MTITVHVLVVVSFCRAFHYNKALWSKKFLPHLTFKAGSPKRRTGTVQPSPKKLPTWRAIVWESDTLEVFHHSPCCIQRDRLAFKAASNMCLLSARPLAGSFSSVYLPNTHGSARVAAWRSHSRIYIFPGLCFAAVGRALDVVVTVRSKVAATM